MTRGKIPKKPSNNTTEALINILFSPARRIRRHYRAQKKLLQMKYPLKRKRKTLTNSEVGPSLI